MHDFLRSKLVSLILFKAGICNFFLQHPFVTQLLTRNLVIELLDMANNPELHSTHTHSLDDNELEVSATRSGKELIAHQVRDKLID